MENLNLQDSNQPPAYQDPPVMNPIPNVPIASMVPPTASVVLPAQEVPPPAPQAPHPPANNNHSHGVSSSDLEMWSEELRILADMGFNDVNMLLPLLRIHCREPRSVQQLLGRERESHNPRAIEQVVEAALALYDA